MIEASKPPPPTMHSRQMASLLLSTCNQRLECAFWVFTNMRLQLLLTCSAWGLHQRRCKKAHRQLNYAIQLILKMCSYQHLLLAMFIDQPPILHLHSTNAHFWLLNTCSCWAACKNKYTQKWKVIRRKPFFWQLSRNRLTSCTSDFPLKHRNLHSLSLPLPQFPYAIFGACFAIWRFFF